MKRKLLDASLIVFATALLVRLTINFAPHGFHLPRLLREDANGVMVISAALALSLGIALLIPHIRWPHNLPPHVRVLAKVTAAVVGAWLLVAALFFSYGFVSGLIHSNASQPQVTWDK